MGTAFSLIATSAGKSVTGARMDAAESGGVVPVSGNGATRSEPSLRAASRGARRAMRTAVIVEPVRVLCIFMGALQFVQGHGILILTLGCVLSVFWLVMIPSGRRSGKR